MPSRRVIHNSPQSKGWRFGPHPAQQNADETFFEGNPRGSAPPDQSEEIAKLKREIAVLIENENRLIQENDRLRFELGKAKINEQLLTPLFTEPVERRNPQGVIIIPAAGQRIVTVPPTPPPTT